MARRNKDTQVFDKGVHNKYASHLIPDTAASDALGWLSRGDRIELSYGKEIVGAEASGSGRVRGHHWGHMNDGTAVQWKKVGTKIKTHNTVTDAWDDVITGLEEDDEYTFANYASLSGNFVFVSGPDGLWKIPTANPTSAVDMYDSTKNYKGKLNINENRTVMWGLSNDKTGLYLSHIDEGNYTTVSGESIGTGDGSTKTFAGTLAFKAGGSTRTCFGIVITDTVETFTDDYSGNLVGDQGGTGTINYATGAYSVTFDTAPTNLQAITGDYQWEDSNNGGITDFTYSTPRLAGEGDIIRQDEGGDATQAVLWFNQIAYSIKERSVYYLDLSVDDTDARNKPFRNNIGLSNYRAAVATGNGLVFMDLSDPKNPRLQRLQLNVSGDELVPQELADHFDFSLYEWDDCAMGLWGEFIVFSGTVNGQDANDRLFLYHPKRNTIDVRDGNFTTFAPNGGFLYAGDAISDNVYKVFTGFDDEGYEIQNHFIGKDDNLTTEQLKKVKKLQFEGYIAPDQSCNVYVSYDDGDFEYVGVIEGSADYVDKTKSYTVGSSMVGKPEIGGGSLLGDDEGGIVYHFDMQMRIRPPKFKRRRVKLVAQGLGYLAFVLIKDRDIRLRGDKMPRKYRDYTQSPV